MADLTLRTAQRPLPGGRILRLGVYSDTEDRPRLAVLAIGFGNGGIADIADPRQEDRLVLPSAALDRLPELLAELEGER